MPPTQEERTLLTLFADVHYLLTPRTHRPAHHRVERGSYFYLYTHLAQQTSRIEIANNPGTPHQDAIAGPLSTSSVTFSYKQPALVSFTLAPQQQQQQQQQQHAPDGAWQIKEYSREHAQDLLYPLHGVDVYFWTERDAARFVDALRALPPGTVGALDVQGKPPQSQHLAGTPTQQQPQQQQRSGSTSSVPLSPVVQKLEQAAITPAYGHTAQQRDSVSTIASMQQPQPAPAQHPHAQGQGMPLPPPAAQPQPQPAQALPPHPSFSPNHLHSGTHSISPPSSAGFSPPPLAYNPAAPAAPETRTHREKTPPPPEYGHAPSAYGPGGMHRADSAGLYSTPTPPVQAGRVNSLPFQNYGGAPAGARASPGAAAPPYSPGMHAQNQGQGQAAGQPSYLSSFTSPAPAPGSGAQQAHSPPPSSASASYTQPQHYDPAAGAGVGGVPDAASIHATAYQPSEAEMAAHSKNAAPGNGGPGKVGRFDRGVDRFLKKLDKNWG